MRVLVTRPEPGASATARRLAALGHAPLVMPLSETRPLAGQTPPETVPNAVAVTSANALRHADSRLLTSLLQTPCFAVGARTADLAGEAGFKNVLAAGGDSRSLAATIGERLPAGAHIFYLCGRTRRCEFEQLLAAAGYACTPLETYETRALTPDPAILKRAGAVDCALVYSPNGARALAGLAGSDEFAPCFEKTQFLCLSPAVADALGRLGTQRVRVAGRPDEEALFALLPKG
ncbi:uroporphyrinogen-III synthase [Mesorhizobium xinjiangense]|uniref:uroporphyrinogen-III synthase n=1 Tax=Mesorhizobium xinjiangense TaxID=2678685 RepID=UPI0012EE4626|nr:uroporphyrinogen-III synthase [Mesorhizobium xinjiangense]